MFQFRWVASWQVTAPKAGTISFSFKNVFITSPQDPAPPLNNDGGGDADGVWMSGSAMPIYKNVLYLATGVLLYTLIQQSWL